MTTRCWLTLEIVLALMVFAVLVSRVPTVEHFLVNNDHGYQLAAGAEVLRGRVPGVDIHINYGPLAVLLPALALYASGGDVVGEVLMCATAWVAVLWIAFRMTRRNFGAVAGLCAGIAAFSCLPRFHKWWIWLVPMAALAAVDAAGGLPGKRRWFKAGVVCGLAALLRADLGGTAFVILTLLALADGRRERRSAWGAAWIPLAVGATLPLVVWMIGVAAVAGSAGLLRALTVIPENLAGTLASLNKPPPALQLTVPLSPDAAHALALRLLPLTEIVAVVLGVWLYRDRQRGFDREGRALMAIGLMGLSTYHHTIYRADIYHLWQGIWPLTLAMPALVALAVRLVRAELHPPRRWSALAVMTTAVGIAFLSTAGLYPILIRPNYDLASFGRAPLAGLRALQQGSAAAPSHPYAQLVDSIQRFSAPDDEVLVLVYGPQLLVFAQRPTSGPTVAFQAGLFDAPAWRRERLALLMRRPPALVVVPMNFWQLGPNDDVRGSLPEISDVVREHYRHVVDRRGRFMLLAPDPSFRPPTS